MVAAFMLAPVTFEAAAFMLAPATVGSTGVAVGGSAFEVACGSDTILACVQQWENISAALTEPPILLARLSGSGQGWRPARTTECYSLLNR